MRKGHGSGSGAGVKRASRDPDSQTPDPRTNEVERLKMQPPIVSGFREGRSWILVEINTGQGPTVGQQGLVRSEDSRRRLGDTNKCPLALPSKAAGMARPCAA